MTDYRIEPHLKETATKSLIEMSRLCNDTLELVGAEDLYNTYYKLFYKRLNVSPIHVFSRVLPIHNPQSLQYPSERKPKGFFMEMCAGLKKILEKVETKQIEQVSPQPCPNDRFFTVEQK